MSKQKGRQRFLSEHLDILPLDLVEADELPPESPKLKLLTLELDGPIEELHLSGDEENVSRNTDFAIQFSCTTEDNSAQKSNAIFPPKSYSILDPEGLMVFKRQRSKSVRNPESLSIFDYLKSRQGGGN
jgi:hypothetical protein